MRYPEALKVSESLIAHLSPACLRVEAVGSLRREKPELDEIDLLAIPDLTPLKPPRAEFGKPVPDWPKTKIEELVLDLEIRGDIVLTANGPRQKKFFYRPGGVRVDLYLVREPATWGVLQLIRTGPHDFSTWIVTHKPRGAMPEDCRSEGGAIYRGEDKIGFESETDFLSFLGLEYIEPRLRRARWERV